jgi:hypothetical protein
MNPRLAVKASFSRQRGNDLQIVANSTSEGLVAIVSNAGVARIPYPVFRGIARTFSTYRAEGHVYVLRWTTNSGRHGLAPSSNLGRLARLANSVQIGAEMIGTTRSRVSFFMNRFRKLGFIDYDGGCCSGSNSRRSVTLWSF